MDLFKSFFHAIDGPSPVIIATALSRPCRHDIELFLLPAEMLAREGEWQDEHEHIHRDQIPLKPRSVAICTAQPHLSAAR